VRYSPRLTVLEAWLGLGFARIQSATNNQFRAMHDYLLKRDSIRSLKETMITRRQFVRTSALAGAALFVSQESSHGQPTPTNLTGVWSGNDGGIYYIRHLEDNSIWWAGLHNSGVGCEKPSFHLGVRFTNVFRGIVDVRNRTVEGSWVDVPRPGRPASSHLFNTRDCSSGAIPNILNAASIVL
jgi:hypothetical protein